MDNKVRFTEKALAKKLKALDGKTDTTQTQTSANATDAADAEHRQEIYLRQTVMNQALIHGACHWRL